MLYLEKNSPQNTKTPKDNQLPVSSYPYTGTKRNIGTVGIYIKSVKCKSRFVSILLALNYIVAMSLWSFPGYLNSTIYETALFHIRLTRCPFPCEIWSCVFYWIVCYVERSVYTGRGSVYDTMTINQEDRCRKWAMVCCKVLLEEFHSIWYSAKLINDFFVWRLFVF